ncbi:hypothetical protein C8N35_108102 [Breoghania corrubedonensis]|uniref:DUF1513 domain-containing protein n=1 Tax=Breoghania corrubedonensis TaxID=665038 RepID=A0A2T5V5R1_9HYPH|nr:DUF1513 domain-containing protein [Breoghania corrubedonensis]PTW59066.1 hypothetical protein C8N35_108102 [Breoghania corrubedonensis]
MRSTEIDRRLLLAGAGAALLAGLAPRQLAAMEANDTLFLSARKEGDSGYAVVVFTPDGKDVVRVPLPGRGHDVTLHAASGRAVAFARRPGTFAAAFDVLGKRAPVFFSSPEERHFYGHGVYSPDGKLLYATENDFENGQGFIGVYDTSDGYRRIAEFASGGVGPHEVLLAPDGRTLVVANGGMETHPDYGRTILNLPTMKPTLALIDRLTGEIIACHDLGESERLSSIRHMTIDGHGSVWFGCQFQGGKTERPQLVGRLKRGDEPELMSAPQDILRGFNNYIGSVMTSRDGETIATSSPRGGQVVYWNAASGEILGRDRVVDGCGVAPRPSNDFLISDGAGELLAGGPGDGGKPAVIARNSSVAWDNHMVGFRV